MRKFNKPSAWVNSKQADAVAEYYTQGHSVKETAEQFGISTVQVNNLVKARRLTNGRKFCPGFNDQSAKLRADAERRLIEALKAKGFEYLGGYERKGSRVRIKCNKCGNIVIRTVENVSDFNPTCSECKKAETRERQEQDRQKRALEAEQRKREREAEKRQKNPCGLSAYQLSRQKLLDDVHICKVCGNEYTLRDYMNSTGTKYYRDSGYCSAECRDAHAKATVKESHKGRQDSHRHRARKFGCAYDPSVKLDKLIERDGLRCAICGEMCDMNDRSWSKFSGPLYPSMDHIIPMAKGGGHTWDNVQVAHIICNSYKSNKLIGGTEDEKS